jgi:hypothetical protein
MIGMINTFVTKVVDTVKSPLKTWGPKAVVKKSKKVSKKCCKNCKC